MNVKARHFYVLHLQDEDDVKDDGLEPFEDGEVKEMNKFEEIMFIFQPALAMYTTLLRTIILN